MKKRSVRTKKSISSSKKTKKTLSKKSGIFRGALGAGTMYAVVALLVVALGGSLMIGNIVPLSTSTPVNHGQPVIISPPVTRAADNNLQLFTFPGITYTPTPLPTTPPQPEQRSSEQSRESSNFGGNDDNSDSGDYSDNSSCFVAGTKILMADMSQKNIEDVKPGDKIMSYDGKGLTGETVTQVESPIRNHHYDIRLTDGTVVGVTDEHPLFTKNGWEAINPENAKKDGLNIEIAKLKIGDSVLKNNGKYVEIKAMDYYLGNVQTYNLKGVTEYNNFFANGVLAHNKGSTDSEDSGGSYGGGGGGGGGGGDAGGGGGGSTGR